MNTNQHNEELIDQYLRGEMSADQLHAFESNVAANPAIQQQLQFQKNIVSGITDYRKLQLKGRLDALEVGSGWHSGSVIGQGVWKIAGGVMVAALIGTGIYLSQNDDTIEGNFKLNIEEEAAPIAYLEREKLEMPIPVAGDKAKEVESSAEDATSTRNKASVNVHLRSTTPVKSALQKSKPSEFTPKVNLPAYEEVSDGTFVAEEVSIPEVSGNDVVKSNKLAPIDVKTINRKAETIKYKYFDGKLFLYGDFKNEPYEILEINSKTSREIYLYHGNSFYQIENTGDVQELKPITSQKLNNELTIIHNNKVN